MYEQKSLDLTSLLLSSIASRVLTSQSVSITCICVTKWWHITRAISLFTPHGICLQILTHKSCEWSPGSSSSSRRFYSPYKKVLERFIEFISLLFPPICHAVWSVFRRMIDEKYVVYTSGSKIWSQATSNFVAASENCSTLPYSPAWRSSSSSSSFSLSFSAAADIPLYHDK